VVLMGYGLFRRAVRPAGGQRPAFESHCGTTAWPAASHHRGRPFSGSAVIRRSTAQSVMADNSVSARPPANTNAAPSHGSGRRAASMA
jgi:hypothetical protein